MLELITGRAGTGKTARIMEEIRAAAQRGEGNRVLIVPEQYSHEAERELCRTVGDNLSLYAEVLSFTGLARRVEEELGRGGRVPLDSGGRLLCMALALDAVGTRLRVYGAARRSPELQKNLLGALDELKSARVTPELLEETAAGCDGSLSSKLSDLALIMGAYDASTGSGRADPADRLAILLENLPRSGFGRTGHIYFDGFTDFTAQESEIVRELMTRGADLTVCLSCDRLDDGSEVFELSRRTACALLRAAKERSIESNVKVLDSGLSGATDFFAEHLFTYTSEKYGGAGGAVSLYSAETITAECELAASRAISLVRDGGCRWRDIAVTARCFEDYRPSLEAAFAYYEAPLFTARKSNILSKPLPALIASAYEATAGGWEADDVFAYLRTGLAGLSASECDILENYCLMWNARAGMWLSKKDWRLHPDGYGGVYDNQAKARLEEINRLRRAASGPLLRLSDRSKEALTASEQSAALCAFFDDLDLPEKLAKRASMLEADGRLQTAAEYERLWDIVVSALEQFTEILGGTEMNTDTFSRLFLLTLSQYDVGIIPVSLDMVTAGDMDRMRRRHIKHLIVLGASDERLPKGDTESGIFSPDERKALSERGLSLDAGDAELWREFSLIYNCLSLPSDTLTMVTPAYSSDGSAARPSFVMSRASKLFDISLIPADTHEMKTAAKLPALELAALSQRTPGTLAKAAAEYFRSQEPERLDALVRAASMPRGRLSSEAVRALYGDKLRLSASRADKLSSCRFAYFLQYGLKAAARKPADFSPPEFGTFMHFVLEHVAAELNSAGGFAEISAERLDALTDKYVQQYIHDTLNDFSEKSPRFIYLFNRLSRSVQRIVADMADELKNSDFQPLDFELDFSRLGGLSSSPLPDGGSLTVTGIADRVDGWIHDDRLYLRVVDYKTGRKSFSLSNVWHGMGLQMLLYLFTLAKNGENLYGREVVPAGVLYVPARDAPISASADMTDEQIAKERTAGLQRSGLVLENPDVLRAMERSEAPVRLPVKWTEGAPSGESLASAERLGLLAKHIDGTLTALAGELRKGSIAADPYYRGAQDNACLYCDYSAACRFSDGDDGDSRRYMKKLRAAEVWNLLEGSEMNG